MIKRSQYLLIALLALSCGSRPNDSSLVIVLLTKDGHPLPGQVVELDSMDVFLDYAHVSDSNGVVTYANLFPGEYRARGGVHGLLQAQGRVTIRPHSHDTLRIVQDITIQEFNEEPPE